MTNDRHLRILFKSDLSTTLTFGHRFTRSAYEQHHPGTKIHATPALARCCFVFTPALAENSGSCCADIKHCINSNRSAGVRNYTDGAGRDQRCVPERAGGTSGVQRRCPQPADIAGLETGRCSAQDPAHPAPAPVIDTLLGNQHNVAAGPENRAFTTLVVDIPGIAYTGVVPPDPVGEAGPNHYIQMVNAGAGSVFSIYNKSGSLISGPTVLSSLWTAGGACAWDCEAAHLHEKGT